MCLSRPRTMADMVGSLVFIFLLLQLLLAFVRPHPPENGAPKSAIRAAWEAFHRTIGPIIIFMGMANVFVGLIMVDAPGWSFAILSLAISAMVGAWVTTAAAATRLGPRHLSNPHKPWRLRLVDLSLSCRTYHRSPSTFGIFEVTRPPRRSSRRYHSPLS